MSSKTKAKGKVRKSAERPEPVEPAVAPKLTETICYDQVEFMGTRKRAVRSTEENIQFLAEVVEKGPRAVAEAHHIQVKSVYGRACTLRKRFKTELQANNTESAILYRKLTDAGILRLKDGGLETN